MTKRQFAKFSCRLGLAAMVMALVLGCAATTPQVPRDAIGFDYSPPDQAEPLSTNLTFAVVGSSFDAPVVGRRGGFASVPMFQRFSRNMADDFVEILTARGYSVRGPFRTYDEMTFPDKEGSNLVLTARIDFQEDTQDLSAKEDVLGSIINMGSSSAASYRVDGNVSIGGRITLIVSESLTNERMWAKSVEFSPITVALNSTRSYGPPLPPTLAQLLQNEPAFHNDIGKALQSQYGEIMNRIYTYLDPMEMAVVDRQADNLRVKKVY